MTPARVLFVDHAPALGGAEHALLLFLEEIDRCQFCPHLATSTGPLAEAGRARGVPVHELALRQLRGTRVAGRLLQGVYALSQLIRREGIDLVFANTLRASVYAALAARLERRPLVWHLHEVLAPRPYVRAICALSSAAIAVSRAAAAPLPVTQKVHVIPNGVRATDFDRPRRPEAQRLRERWRVPADAVLIGQVARLDPQKGQGDVIAAAERLRDLESVRVVIVGGDIFGTADRYARELRKVVHSRGLADRVVFAGHQQDVPSTLQALNILVHASHTEAFGRILIEAGAAGLPVVAYDSGAVSEIVRHEITGLLVPLHDRTALAASLRRLATNRSLAVQLGNQARDHVRDQFDSSHVTRLTEAVLRSVLNSG